MFPYVYQQEFDTWLYLKRQDDFTWFYHFDLDKWVRLSQ